MCAIYAMEADEGALIREFKLKQDRMASLEMQRAIFPGGEAPIIRKAEDGQRELVNMSWGFVLPQHDKAPKRVTNTRDDKVGSRFWSASVRERRCLVPVTSFAEPKGKKPAIWHWFAQDDERPVFAFAGIWRTSTAAVKKDAAPVTIDTFSFLTTKPNELVETVHPSRMPVMLVGEWDYTEWLDGTPEEAMTMARPYPARAMKIVQASEAKYDRGR